MPRVCYWRLRFPDSLSTTLIETRVLVHKKDTSRSAWYPFVYSWENGRSQLEPDSGRNSFYELAGGRRLPWRHFSKRECLSCHVSHIEEAVEIPRSILGFVPPQLNLNTEQGNQLNLLFAAGAIASPQPRDFNLSFSYADISEVDQPVVHRVYSYLAVNCSHCHGEVQILNGSTLGMTEVFMDYSDFSDSLDIFYQLVDTSFFWPRRDVVVPGEPRESQLIERMLLSDNVPRELFVPFNQMPPAGSYRIDSSAVSFISAWICSLGKGSCPDVLGIPPRHSQIPGKSEGFSLDFDSWPLFFVGEQRYQANGKSASE